MRRKSELIYNVLNDESRLNTFKSYLTQLTRDYVYLKTGAVTSMGNELPCEFCTEIFITVENAFCFVLGEMRGEIGVVL